LRPARTGFSRSGSRRRTAHGFESLFLDEAAGIEFLCPFGALQRRLGGDLVQNSPEEVGQSCLEIREVGVCDEEAAV
jgi:hypothetical protein